MTSAPRTANETLSRALIPANAAPPVARCRVAALIDLEAEPDGDLVFGDLPVLDPPTRVLHL